ncbi:MAG: hypothetical protein ABSF98_15815 [Bryobacteraceae bacterium]|jgi:hypothetical protein
MRFRLFIRLVIPTLFAAGLPQWAASLPPELKDAVEARAKRVQTLGSDPQVVAAVKAYNANPPAEARSMTNEKWKALSILDPFARSLSKGPLVDHLKSVADPAVSKLFVSGRDGTKVVYFAKTISWNHSDQDKHRVPMTGKVWYGPKQVDPSTGLESIQVGVPVLDGGKPIGSIVVDLTVSRLR